MPIADTDGGRHRGSSLFERMTDARSVTHHRFEGPALLQFPEGGSCLVEAQLFMSRSRFSTHGEGYIRCAAEVGFEALDSSGWLTLSFSGITAVGIEVHDVKAQDGQCRCRFEVRP